MNIYVIVAIKLNEFFNSSCNNLVCRLFTFIDWLLFNANFSNISGTVYRGVNKFLLTLTPIFTFKYPVHLILDILYFIVFGLKCYTCNSKQHPGVCDYRGNLTEQHSQHIVDCQGSCKVGTMRNNIDEGWLMFYIWRFIRRRKKSLKIPKR